MAQKTDLITALRFANQETLAFAAGLNDVDRSTSGTADHWAARDVLAHIGTGDRDMAATITAVSKGENPPSGITNEECYLHYKDQPWNEIELLVRSANTSLMEQVQALSEAELNAQVELLNGRLMWRVIAGSSFLHKLTHLAQALIERGERERAIQLNEQTIQLGMQVDDKPDWQGLFLYNTGCYLALLGEKQKALESLEKGMRLNPQLIEFSKLDTDLVSLHGDTDFLSLLDRAAQQAQA
jgi:tetratricopeptide (TPR) repeat protein